MREGLGTNSSCPRSIKYLIILATDRPLTGSYYLNVNPDTNGISLTIRPRPPDQKRADSKELEECIGNTPVEE